VAGATPMPVLCLRPLVHRDFFRLYSSGQNSISLLIGFISVNNSPWTDYSAYSYFQIVTMCDLVMILFFYIIHIFRIYRKLTCVSWPLATFGFLATVLCVLSIWSSYKVSCITQSTSKYHA
uniref:CKLF like MARVEL transmembrane domain containing 7 n=1 Tax=Athene cunicularia TaxID=194338 RepID=A0A663MGN1_ATHCN